MIRVGRLFRLLFRIGAPSILGAGDFQRHQGGAGRDNEPLVGENEFRGVGQIEPRLAQQGDGHDIRRKQRREEGLLVVERSPMHYWEIESTVIESDIV
jgi:hypothetical protein